MDTIHLRKRLSRKHILGIASLIIAFALGSVALGANISSAQKSAAGEESQTTQFNPTTAQLQNIRGRVEVQTLDGQWQALSSGDLIAAGQRVRTRDLSSVILAFYDGSTAHLQANTELSIEALNAQEGEQQRIVRLYQWSGESSHTVAKNDQEGSVYAVGSPGGTGEAMGTEFRVLVMPAVKTVYFVIDGIVSVTNIQVTVLLNPGEYTIVLPEQPPSNPLPYMTAEGMVTQLGETWIIDGAAYQVNEQTAIIGNIQVGDWVHVDAHLLSDGSRVADFILLTHASPLNHFSLSGIVDAIGDQQWTINGQTVAVTGATIEPNIATGDQVKVDGLIQEDGKLLAVTIAREALVQGLPFDFTGFLEKMDTPDSWTISNMTIGITSTTTIDQGLVVGDLVKVEGWIQTDGDWIASSIRLTNAQDNQFEFTGTIENMDPWVVSKISLEIQDWTVIDAGLQVGDIVHVSGEITSDGFWVATTIEKVDSQTSGRIILIGAVFSIDPWVVSGIPLSVTTETVIEGEIRVGMLVRVEMQAQPDGSWIILKIQPLQNLPIFPGCIDVIATVSGYEGNQIQLIGWPALTLSPDVQISGDLVPNTIVRVHVCFSQDASVQVTLIVVIGTVDPDNEADLGEKVFVCHKPDKKGGHTLNISSAALPAHLGHGDYQGPCR
jgi:hypothetical protein